MTLKFEDSVRFLYHHVRVTTLIKRTAEFKSDFLAQSHQNAGKGEDDSLAYEGYLKVIDPISKSTIICLIDDASRISKNLLILGQNIASIEPSQVQGTILAPEVRTIVDADNSRKVSSLPFLNKLASRAALIDDLTIQRGRSIVEWLTINRIPCNINADTHEVVIGGVVRIRPPYEHEANYVCPTRVMLKRIMHIVNSRNDQR